MPASIQVDRGGSQSFFGWITDTTTFTQTFVAAGTTITDLAFQIDLDSSNSASLRVLIAEVLPDNTLGAFLYDSGTIDVTYIPGESLGYGGGPFRDINLSMNVAVTNGANYVIIWDGLPDLNGNDNLAIGWNTDDVYSGGRMGWWFVDPTAGLSMNNNTWSGDYAFTMNFATNAAPTLSGPVTSTKTEDDAVYSLNLLAGATDGDGDTLNVSGLTLDSGDASGVSVSLDGNSLDIDPDAYDHLAVGDSEVITYSYTVDDGNGGTVAQTATITITGVNDAPTVGATISGGGSEDDPNFSVNLLAGAADDDDGTVLAVSNLLPTSGDNSGIVLAGNSLDVTTNAYNYLAAGESAVVNYSFDVIDGDGGSVAQTATVTITGVNDGPDAKDDYLGAPTTSELIVNGGFESGAGSWTQSDAGSGGWSVEADTSPPNGTYTTPGPNAGVNYIVSYQTGPGVHALTQSFTVPTGTSSLSLSFALFAQSGAAEAIHGAGLDYLSSPNQHARVDLLIDGATVYSTSATDVVRNLYLGLDGDPTQAWTVYTFDLSADLVAGATYQLRFAEVDNQFFFNLGVDAVSLTATTVLALTDEDTAIVIDGADLLANDTDPDTTDVLEISAVDGVSALGAAITLNGDGTIDYDPSGALDYLAEGEVVEDSFTYTISDGNGGSDTATVTFKVVGVNDAPSAPIDEVAPDGASISEHLAVGSEIGLDADSTDPEGDTVDYYFRDGGGVKVQTLGKFTIDSVTGVVTLAAAVNYELQTSYSLRIYAGDGSDESFTDFTVTIENVVEHLFTPGNDGLPAAPINFNLLADGAYDFDDAYYDALAGNDFVYLPNMATVDAGNPWDYAKTFNASAGNDVVQGGDGNDIISGGDGDDRLFGATGDDRLVGSAGNDMLAGGDGSDKLTGASGRDIFIFTDSELGTTKLGEHDTITDFQQGTDKIDLSALYDGVAYGGLRNGALTGTAVSANKVGVYSASGKTWIEGDVTGDGVADFVIELAGSYKIKAADLVLGTSFIESQSQWNSVTSGANWLKHHQEDYFL